MAALAPLPRLPPPVHIGHILNDPEYVEPFFTSPPLSNANGDDLEASTELEVDVFADPSSNVTVVTAITTTTTTTTTPAAAATATATAAAADHHRHSSLPSFEPYPSLSEKPLPNDPEPSSVMGIAGAQWATSLLASATSKPEKGLWQKFRKRTGRWAWWIIAAIALLVVTLIIIIILAATGVLGQQQQAWSTPTSSSNGSWNMSGSGDGTYYAPGLGACGIENTDSDMIVALNWVDYGQYANPNKAIVCKKCIEITGPLGTVRATITDKCPGCKKGDVDMSPAVYNKIADPVKGRVPISWHGC